MTATTKNMPNPPKLASVRRAPTALFDTIKQIDTIGAPTHLTSTQRRDFDIARSFLQAYIGSLGTFNSYRRDVERLLQWTWHIADKRLEVIKRDDIEAFIHFFQRPPSAWIGTKKAPRFVIKDGTRQPNLEWRPFVATLSKSAFKKGQVPDKAEYASINGSIKELMAIVGSFFQYLQIEEYCLSNPVALIR